MNSILVNLSDPSWWFNGVISVIAAIWLPKLATYLLSKLRAGSRQLRAKRLRRIHRLRRDSLLITYEMQKANALFIVFALIAVTAVGIFLSSSLARTELGISGLALTLSLPTLFAEFAWVLKDSFVSDLLKYREKLGS